jgi:hypothetical protein
MTGFTTTGAYVRQAVDTLLLSCFDSFVYKGCGYGGGKAVKLYKNLLTNLLF